MANKDLDRISPFPFWETLKGYTPSHLRGDLVAALTVALMALPQSVAYAFVADLPTSAGIFAAIFGTIFTAAFGSSRYLVSGPSNTVAILIQSGTSEILHTYYGGVIGAERDLLALQIVLQVVLLIGIFQIVGGLLKLGRATQFASRSVVVGYMAGAAFAIVVTQLYPFFGIREMGGYRPIYQQGWFLLGHLTSLNVATTLIGIGCLLLLIFLFRASQKIPGAILVFILAGLVVFLFNLSPGGVPGLFDIVEGGGAVKVTLLSEFGPLYSDLPHFRPPAFEFKILVKAIPLAFAITLLSVLEATAIGRNYARAKDPPYSDNQEVFGLGISNALSSFLGAMPSSGSFSRSALNITSGGRTRFSALLSGVILFLIVILLGPLVRQIPLTALAALMLFTAYTMVNFRHLFLCLKATRVDGFVVIVTFISSLLFPLDVALYVGVILSVVLYLKQAAVPLFIEYAFNNVGKLRPLESEDERPDPRICIVQAEGELFFGAAEQLQMKLRQIAEEEGTQVIILQILNVHHIDASVCLALLQVHAFLKTTGRHLLISGATPEVERVLQDAGLRNGKGADKFFPANEQLPSEPTRSAYAFAKQLLS